MLFDTDSLSDSSDDSNMVMDCPDIIESPPDSKICRVCLVTEGKMYHVTEYNLDSMYLQITGVKWDPSDRLASHVCSECSQRLQAAIILRSKALRSHHLLLDLCRQSRPSIEDIKSVDRERNKLASTLAATHFLPYSVPATKDELESSGEELSGRGHSSLVAILTAPHLPPPPPPPPPQPKPPHAPTHNHTNGLLNSVQTEEGRSVAAGAVVRAGAGEAGEAGGGTAIDELIAIYNNDGDGDRRLQELNDTQTHTHEPHNNKQKQIPKKRAKGNDRLDQTLFTIKPVSAEEQIEEIRKRQETIRFKRAPYKCDLCFRGFVIAKAHDAHMMRHNPINGAYECMICRARQKSPRAVKTHLYAHHSVRIRCNKCEFTTMNRSVARSHERWHAGTIYQCPHCPSHFDQESTYKTHLRVMHVHAFACAFCGFTFVSAKGLCVHKCKRHAAIMKVPLLGPNCEVCEIRFISEEAYSRHLKLSSRHSSNNLPSNIVLRVADN